MFAFSSQEAWVSAERLYWVILWPAAKCWLDENDSIVVHEKKRSGNLHLDVLKQDGPPHSAIPCHTIQIWTRLCPKSHTFALTLTSLGA